MRAFAAALCVAACATLPPPNERVAGCWIARDDFGATTMRWLPDRERPGVLAGDWLRYQRNGAATARSYTLAQEGEGWRLCLTGANAQCWDVAQGEGGSLEGGRAFIDAGRDRLRIAVHSGGREDVIFSGRRDGCD